MARSDVFDRRMGGQLSVVVHWRVGGYLGVGFDST